MEVCWVQCRNSRQKYTNTTHTKLKNMMGHCTTLLLQLLCPLSPWRHLPWTQILTPLLPMGPCKVHGVSCALTGAGSLYWGIKMQPIKKQSKGWGLGLRWPPFGQKIQQPTKRWCFQRGWYWRGCTTWVERVWGGAFWHCLGQQIRWRKKFKNVVVFDGNQLNTTTNKKHSGAS